MTARLRVLDCDRGRAMGCATFCCRLIVRLRSDERDPGQPARDKSCVDKDPATGLCVYLDPGSHRCTVWERRPAVCRAYDCNEDPSLQRVLREGFVSLTELVRGEDRRRTVGGPVAVPRLHGGEPDEDS